MTTVVLGLDGAAFELIDRWIDDGTLPTFARLVDEGAATDMQSCLPPVTCPNWQCYATGTNPGKLGVFWWERVDPNEQVIRNTNASTDFDGRYYWEYLDGESAVINLPTSYPPPVAVDGVHVAGGPGAEQTGYTTPPDLEQRLVDEYEYAVHPDQMSELSADAPDNSCVLEISDLIETRFDVLEEFVADDQTEFVHCTVFYLNVLQHFYWDHEVVREAWECIDARVADLLDRTEVETLYVMSDHGSNEIETTFHINAWLERQGYLETTAGISDLLHMVGLTRERIRSVAGRLRVEWWLRQLVPQRIQFLLPDYEGSVTQSGKADVLDWGESVAIASGQGPLYIIATDPGERERLRAELVSKLEDLEYGGRTIVDAAIPAKELYEGPYLDRAPDLLLRQAPGVHIAESLGGEHDPFESPKRWRGENKETGIFIAYGEDIDPEADLPEMHILDIAPTILHHTGTAIPTNLDGQVRTELFTSDSEPGERDPTMRPPAMTGPTESVETDSGVSDRLSDLGYLQ